MKRKIFLLLFALPFFGVGVWMLISISTHLVDAGQMRHWEPVQAALSNAGYETVPGAMTQPAMRHLHNIPIALVIRNIPAAA